MSIMIDDHQRRLHVYLAAVSDGEEAQLFCTAVVSRLSHVLPQEPCADTLRFEHVMQVTSARSRMWVP